jgi:hypothetical protein
MFLLQELSTSTNELLPQEAVMVSSKTLAILNLFGVLGVQNRSAVLSVLHLDVYQASIEPVSVDYTDLGRLYSTAR